MRIDRVSEDIFVVVSGLYAQATATVLLTHEGAVVIDSLPFPSETRQLVSFVESEIGRTPILYVINTHHHADHVYGNYLFPDAEIIAHDACRDLLLRVGQPQLDRAQEDTVALADVKLRVPDITFASEMHLQVGHRHVHLFHTPGHSLDGISLYVDGEKVLIAGDAMMPVPVISGGDVEQLKTTLARYLEIGPGFLIQGHGSVLLKGEARTEVKSNIRYLDTIVKRVHEIVERGDPPSVLREIDIESCGKSRIPLDGLVSRLHLDNLVTLYKRYSDAPQV